MARTAGWMVGATVAKVFSPSVGRIAMPAGMASCARDGRNAKVRGWPLAEDHDQPRWAWCPGGGNTVPGGTVCWDGARTKDLVLTAGSDRIKYLFLRIDV